MNFITNHYYEFIANNLLSFGIEVILGSLLLGGITRYLYHHNEKFKTFFDDFFEL